MPQKEPLGNRIGWFIGYNAARIYGWIEDAYDSIKHFILGIPDSIRLFFLKF
jgi:hypothetical protein